MSETKDVINRMSTRALTICGLAAAATAWGYFQHHETFWQSYLVGYMFWLFLTLGSLGVLMIQHLTGGAWGLVARRVLEASTRNLPLMAVLFLPIALNMPALFSWARPEAANDPIIQQKAAYLNVNFFYIRAAIYFAIWIGLMALLTSWSAKQDIDAPLPPGPVDRRFRVVSGPGLVLFMLTVTGMSVDWIMSLDPHWYSTIIGVLSVGGMGLGTMAFCLVVLSALSQVKPMSEYMTVDRFHDLGKLMYAFVLLWAYFSVSQLIIVWSANLPEEIPFYIKRFNGPWGWVSVVVLVGHFVIPFTLLLSRSIKRSAKKVAMVAMFVLAMRAVDIAWIIGPMIAHGEHAPAPNWVDFAAVLGLGVVWLPMFFRNLSQRSVIPAHDPYLKDAIAHGGH